MWTPLAEFDRFGGPEFNAEFPIGVSTYRAYLLPWPGAGRWWHDTRRAAVAHRG